MNEVLFSMFALGGSFNEPEYANLSDEEKANLDFMDSCIYNEDERISKASFYVMLLLIELSAEPDKYEPEEIGAKLELIYKDLKPEEVKTMTKFELACIKSMGVYSEERKQERQLKRERKIKNE